MNPWKLATFVLAAVLLLVVGVNRMQEQDGTRQSRADSDADAGHGAPRGLQPPSNDGADSGRERPEQTPESPPVASLPDDPHAALFEALNLFKRGGFSYASRERRFERLSARVSDVLPILEGWIRRESELGRAGVNMGEICEAYGYLGGAAAVPFLEQWLRERYAKDMASRALEGLCQVDDPAGTAALARYAGELPANTILSAGNLRHGSPATCTSPAPSLSRISSFDSINRCWTMWRVAYGVTSIRTDIPETIPRRRNTRFGS